MDTNYAFGECNVEHQEQKRATPDELIIMAKKIWSEVNVKTTKTNDELLNFIQDKYKDFTTSFPLVIRWMVQMKQFNVEALRKWLLKHGTAQLKTRTDFLELQADYLVLLYRETHSHPDEKFMKNYRASIIEELLKEDKEFIEVQKQIEDEMEKSDEEFNVARRKQLFEYLLTCKNKEL